MKGFLESYLKNRSALISARELLLGLKSTGILLFINVIVLLIETKGSIRLVYLYLVQRIPRQIKGTSILCKISSHFSIISISRGGGGGWGAQWLSGRVLDSRQRVRGLEPHRRHCVVVLEQDTFILA